MTVPEVAKALGIGKNRAYRAVARGQIPGVQIGDQFVVARVVVEKFLRDGMPWAEPKEGPEP